MKAYEITVHIIDFDGVGSDGIKDAIENARYPNHCISPKVSKCRDVDIGKWDDDHPLNRAETAYAEWERLFGGGSAQ